MIETCTRTTSNSVTLAGYRDLITYQLTTNFLLWRIKLVSSWSPVYIIFWVVYLPIYLFVPFQMISCVSYVVLSYWLTDNPLEPTRATLFLATVVATSLCGQAWGYFIGSTTPTKVSSNTYLLTPARGFILLARSLLGWVIE